MKKTHELVNLKIENVENNEKMVNLIFQMPDETPIIRMTIDKNTIPSFEDKEIFSKDDIIAFVQLLFHGHTDLLTNWIKFGISISQEEPYDEEHLDNLIHYTKHVLGYAEEDE